MKASVAIITGASRGIGRATAFRFAAAGYDITINSTNELQLKKVAQEIELTSGRRVLAIAGDLAVEATLTSLIKETEEKFGRIDVLVNNAAWRTIETIRTMNYDTWQKTLAVNLSAPAFLARAAALSMEKRKEEGIIINIGSIMATRPGGNSPAYIACKGGIESLTRELAVTFGRSRIRAVCISPGFIDTEMSSDYTAGDGQEMASVLAQEMINSTPLKRAGTSEEIAELVYWLSSPAASFITGTNITIDGGFMSNFNSYLTKKIMFPTQYVDLDLP